MNPQHALQYAPLNLDLQSVIRAQQNGLRHTVPCIYHRSYAVSFQSPKNMRKLDHNVADGASERHVADGHLWEGGRMFREAAFQRQAHCSQLSTGLIWQHKAVFKKTPVQNYSYDRQTRSVKYTMTAYALNPVYLRWSPEVFAFPVSFKILTVHASYTVGDRKRKQMNSPFNNKISRTK